jgi:phospho-N-acetylmuramoyl-pentapeptide-transferase
LTRWYTDGPAAWALAQTDALIFGAAFFGSVILCVPVIGVLRKLSFGKQAYEDAPKTHAVKTGTPTMGGVVFALALLPLAAYFAWAQPDSGTAQQVFEIALLGLACGAIGFSDDLLGVRRGRNRGLDGRTKLVLTMIVAGLFLVAIRPHVYQTEGSIPDWLGSMPSWMWYALAFVALVGTTHAVNLTDGLDGLAAGTIVPPLAVFASIAIFDGYAGVAAVDLATLGAALGFLVYNRYPARLFMGDTGSLFLGGILAGSAIVLQHVLLLPLVGAVFAAEALSVIVQVAYFKRTRKRIFKMSPLHHHFELSGWSETKVTHWFWAASALCSVAGAATLYAARGSVP